MDSRVELPATSAGTACTWCGVGLGPPCCGCRDSASTEARIAGGPIWRVATEATVGCALIEAVGEMRRRALANSRCNAASASRRPSPGRLAAGARQRLPCAMGADRVARPRDARAQHIAQHGPRGALRATASSQPTACGRVRRGQRDGQVAKHQHGDHSAVKIVRRYAFEGGDVALSSSDGMASCRAT